MAKEKDVSNPIQVGHRAVEAVQDYCATSGQSQIRREMIAAFASEVGDPTIKQRPEFVAALEKLMIATTVSGASLGIGAYTRILSATGYSIVHAVPSVDHPKQ